MKSKLRLAGAFAALATLALAVGCRGFFVKPTLTSLAVGPGSPSIQTGTTNNQVQMFVVGTFNDGSNGTPAVSWSISDDQIATITSGGLVTSVGIGSATITATATQNPSITGTQSLSVTVGCIQSITLDPTSGSLSNGGLTSIQITATAHTCNGDFPITDVAQWTSSDTNVATVQAGLVVATGNSGGSGTVTISASSGGVTSNPNATVTVTGF